MKPSPIYCNPATQNRNRRRRFCAHCGREYPPPLYVTGPVRRRLIEILVDRPSGVSVRALADLVYADDPNGGPLAAQRSLNVIAHHANRQLATQGYRIRAEWRGRGAFYRLVRTSNIGD